MKIGHPFLCGCLLAFAVVLPTAFFGTLLIDGAFSGDTRLLMLLAGAAGGALMASVPGRIRRRHEKLRRPDWRRCLIAFGGGAVMLPALRLAGMDSFGSWQGVMQGGAGALAFAGLAWLAALVSARLIGRWLD